MAPKICTVLSYLTAGKSRTKLYNFLCHMVLPSNSFKKWPLCKLPQNGHGLDQRPERHRILIEIQNGTSTEYKNVFITTTVHINFKGLQKQ